MSTRANAKGRSVKLGLVSVIIPAYNAAATLEKAIASLQAQTYEDWEAVIVDDGSMDQTLPLARELAAQDARLRVFTQPQGGESTARNTGIDAAKGEAVVFLDADDWLLSAYLERMVLALGSDPTLDVVYCGHYLVTPDGRRGPDVFPWWRSDIFAELCRRNPFAIHTCLARRAMVEAVGHFDTRLRTAPDWDFWQRAARQGARFGEVREVLACYLVRPGSATSRAAQLLVDGLTIIDRGHRSDLRVANPEPRYAAGVAPEGAVQARLYYACWVAGLAIGQGHDARPLLDRVADGSPCELSPQLVAEWLYDAVPWPSGRLQADWPELWPQVSAGMQDFLAELELRLHTPNLGQQSRLALWRLVHGDEVMASQKKHSGPAPAAAATGEQQRRQEELEQANAWLMEQVDNWQHAVAERDQQITNLKAWIEQLEAGKRWLEEQRTNWMRTADDRARELQRITRWPWLRWLRPTRQVVPPTDALSAPAREAAPPAENSSDAIAPTPTVAAPPSSLEAGTGPFANTRLVEPVSRAWGYDRGQPVDRYYIENFLARSAADVRGRVLEIGDDSYTRRYGGERVTQREVLNVAPGHPQTTIVADLGQADALPAEAFDCIILTQTLQLIFDTRTALKSLGNSLKPGGVLLLTCPGLTRTSQTEWPGSWYWRFTPASLGRLLEETLTDCDLQVESHGNVLAASAFLYGLALEELNREELDHHDADYDVILTVRAVKWAPASKLAEPPAQAARGRKRQAQGLILLYHRVADANVDPWLMVVAPVHFAEQMDVLQRAFQPVRLDELAQAVAHGSTQRPPVAVTFDDGYADNLYAALPILEANAVPATFFITTGGLARRSEYWWDTLERLLLWPRTLPETLQLTIAGQAFSWTLEGWGNYPEAAWAEQRQWRAWQPPPTPRHALFTALWEQLHLLPPEIRQRTLDNLAGWAQSPSEPQQRSLGLDELQRLAQSPFVEIGAHSVTHPSLARLLSEAQRREIEDSQQWLAQHLQRPIRAFTYPFGKPVDYSPETIRLVREAGFERACINTAGVIAPESDVFQWPRIHVLDWTGTEFEEALHRWLAG